VSYTTDELVRRHLADTRPLADRVTDQAIVLGESGWVLFWRGPIEAGTVVVKALRGAAPLRRALALAGGSAALGVAPVVPGSVVAASDSSLGTIYAENVDFVIDYPRAVFYAKAGGALADDASVTVWLREYTLCAPGLDYALDAEAGALRRLAGGSIAPVETVRLDYTPLYAAGDDMLIAAAVAEANGLVGAAVDPARAFGADPALEAAATCHALAVVCRGSAARVLATRPEQERAAAAWTRLSELYADRADRLLAAFHPPAAGPAAPSAV